MDVELQLIWVDQEIRNHTIALSSLQAIRDTITGQVAPQLASIVGLQTRIGELEKVEAVEIKL